VSQLPICLHKTQWLCPMCGKCDQCCECTLDMFRASSENPLVHVDSKVAAVTLQRLRREQRQKS